MTNASGRSYRRTCLRLSALFSLLLAGWRSAAAPPLRPPTPVPPPQDLPGVHVSLSRPLYVIHIDPRTGDPEMPRDVVADAEVINWPVGMSKPTSFLWRACLDWDFAPYSTHHSIGSRIVTHGSPYTIDFGREIRGGTLTVYAKAFWNGVPVFGMAQAQIQGENPSRSAIFRRLPPSRFGLIASKVAMVESGLRQFSCAPGQTGMPILSRTNDIGLMQLNAPSGAVTAPDQVWDWRANLQQGLDMLTGKRRIMVLASRHAVNLNRAAMIVDGNFLMVSGLNFYRMLLGMAPLVPPAPSPLSYAPGSGILSGEPDPDHLILNQFEREMVRRYNGGREYAYTLVCDPNTLTLRGSGWTVDPLRGGIRVTSGDPDYVLHVLSVRSGFSIPKPVKKTHSGPHRRRRRHPHRG